MISPRALFTSILAAVLVVPVTSREQEAPPGGRPRARDLGVTPGVFDPGPWNAITDVPGVRVGHVTLIEGENVRTGVTAVLPHPGNLFREKVAGAVFVANAFGKLAGSTQVRELGTIESPVILTNTLAVAAGIEGAVQWTLAQPGNGDVRSVNALVGETNDGKLNDIRGRHVGPEHVIRAIESARDGAPAEGGVGAGTGTVAFGWKGGMGTSSRRLPGRFGGYTVGTLVQANFGGVLTIDGAKVGQALGVHAFGPRAGASTPSARDADGSCMIVVATDAPLDARDLERLAARAAFGLARTGSSYSNGSGDYAIAFSTAPALRVRHGEASPAAAPRITGDALSPLFQAALETTEEAVYNALLRATTMTGNGVTVDALPIDRVREILARRGR
jgi:D-aminopeptidase